MSKLDQLRALREARQSSRGDVESRNVRVGKELTVKGRTEAEKQPLETLKVEGATTRQAGVAPGPRETKLGRPRLEDRDQTIEARKPWLALKMSRTTWYRRQAEKRVGKTV